MTLAANKIFSRNSLYNQWVLSVIMRFKSNILIKVLDMLLQYISTIKTNVNPFSIGDSNKNIDNI